MKKLVKAINVGVEVLRDIRAELVRRNALQLRAIEAHEQLLAGQIKLVERAEAVVAEGIEAP